MQIYQPYLCQNSSQLWINFRLFITLRLRSVNDSDLDIIDARWLNGSGLNIMNARWLSGAEAYIS